jgi:hypothetical protein
LAEFVAGLIFGCIRLILTAIVYVIGDKFGHALLKAMWTIFTTVARGVSSLIGYFILPESRGAKKPRQEFTEEKYRALLRKKR